MMEIDNPNKDIKIDVKLLINKTKFFNKINPPSKSFEFVRLQVSKYVNLSKNPDDLNSAVTDNVPQYATLYHLRFHQLKEKIKLEARMRWPNLKICDNILKLKAKNEEQIIVGVFYKEMALRPSILKGIESILGAKKLSSFISESDSLFFEDNCSRLKINSDNDFIISNFITGIIAGLRGYIDDKDTFVIKDILFHQPDYINLNLTYNREFQDINNLINSKNEIIAFTSGLNIGGKDINGKGTLSRNMLIDFFQGKLFSNKKLSEMVKRISRLIICGNLIVLPEDIENVMRGTFSKNQLNHFVYKSLLDTYTQADQFLEILSSTVFVDLMPGPEDISNSVFPQSPVSNVLFEKGLNTKNLNLVPNPYNFMLDKVNFMITSGQNISNIQQITNISQDSIEIMKKTLQWSHLAPSAPDTLSTFPISKEDPLIINTLPNVYAIGNQKSFRTKLDYTNEEVNITRFICVPEFYKSFSIVLMDKETLEAFEFNMDFIQN